MLKKKKLITPIFYNQSLENDDENLINRLKHVKEELAILNSEKKKRANELEKANKEISFQGKQKGKRAAELVVANKELKFQNKEKEKRASELAIANKELEFQNKEKEKRAAELVIANKELEFQNNEKEKRAAELTLVNSDLKKAEESQKEYIKGLEKMIFITSHKVRQPITQIQGVSSLLNDGICTQEELMLIIDSMKISVQALDIFTRELTSHIYELQNKVNTNTDEVH